MSDNIHNISILGSTGSIGTQSLDVVRSSGTTAVKQNLNVVGIAANRNIALLEAQAREFRPELACIADKSLYADLKLRLSDTSTTVVCGEDGLCEVAAHSSVRTVITALMGIAGLKPTVCAIREKKNIALANKETMVAAGAFVSKLAKENNVSILPVDSEHSAIFQSLAGMADKSELRRIILTASGGPFFGKSRSELEGITPEQALKHPNWDMGAKITIDSASMVNKGLEVIEARWLFDISPAQIDVVVHRQSIIHSMIEYIDGSVIAQMGLPDMRLPIAFALTYPNRMAFDGRKLDFAALANLTFAPPDNETFPSLPLAYKSLEAGGTMSAVFNGADEMAVSLFLQKKIPFLGIADVIAEAMNAYTNTEAACLEDIYNADRWAREYVIDLASRT